MNGGYAKLWGSILTSTVWGESHGTRIVWLAMLASANAVGIVEGSVPGFAHVARVTLAEMEEALSVLRAPDPHSRTQEFEGRRIEDVDGGWRILNHAKYREKNPASKRALYMRSWRARKTEDPRTEEEREKAGRAAAALRWEQAQAARDGTVPLEGLSESEKIVELARRLKAKADERADEEAE